MKLVLYKLLTFFKILNEMSNVNLGFYCFFSPICFCIGMIKNDMFYYIYINT